MAEMPASGPGGGPIRERPDPAAAKRLGETIYGTLILMSVLTYVSEDSDDPREVLAVVIGTAVVLFLTRWFAEVLGDTLTNGKVPGRRAGRRIARDAVPLLGVAIVPLFLVILAVAKVLDLELAVSISLLIGAVSLAVWGYLKARRTGAGPFGTIFIIVSTLGLGILLVGLKAAFH